MLTPNMRATTKKKGLASEENRFVPQQIQLRSLIIAHSRCGKQMDNKIVYGCFLDKDLKLVAV